DQSGCSAEQDRAPFAFGCICHVAETRIAQCSETFGTFEARLQPPERDAVGHRFFEPGIELRLVVVRPVPEAAALEPVGGLRLDLLGVAQRHDGFARVAHCLPRRSESGAKNASTSARTPFARWIDTVLSVMPMRSAISRPDKPSMRPRMTASRQRSGRRSSAD